MTLTLTVYGDTLFWNGPNTTYNVFGKGTSGSYTYATNTSSHSTKIWSPSVVDISTDISYIVVSSVNLSVSGTISYSLGRLSYDVSSITSFTGKNIIIPATYDTNVIPTFGLTFRSSVIRSIIIDSSSEIQSVDATAFEKCYSLLSINIPRSVTTVGSSAFDKCGLLYSVVFDESSNCSSIGEYAFRGCIALPTITIPYSVSSIGTGAFQGCIDLLRFIFDGLPPSDNQAYDLNNAVGFYYYRYDASWSQTTPAYEYSNIPMYAIPDNVTMNGTTLSWIGPTDVSYTVYVAGNRSDIDISGVTADVSSQLQFGIHFYVTSTIDGLESPQSTIAVSSILRAPTDLSLSGTTLSWSGPTDVYYNVYVANILHDLSGTTGLSVDISSQLQYGIGFNVTAANDGNESPQSTKVISSILRAPTNLFISGTILTWKGPLDVSYAIYYTTPTGYTQILTQSGQTFNFQLYTGLNLFYIVRSTYNSSESTDSSTIHDLSVFAGSSVNPVSYIQTALDASSSITMLKYQLITNSPSFASSIATIQNIDMSRFVSSVSPNASLTLLNVSFLLPNADISSSVLPDTASSIYLLGDVGTTVVYRVDNIEYSVFFDASSITINGIPSIIASDFDFGGRTYTLIGIGSGLGVPPYIPPPPIAPPCNPFVYPHRYNLGEEQRVENRRIIIANPEILTATGHRFASNADRISVIRENLFRCRKPEYFIPIEPFP